MISDTFALQQTTSKQVERRPDGSYRTNIGATQAHEGAVVEVRKNSVVTSNYALLKRQGMILPENDFLYSRRSRAGVINSVETRPSHDDVIHRQRPVLRYPGAWFSDEPWPDFTNLEIKLLNDLKGQTWNAPQTILEARKTLEMATAAMTRLGAGMVALRRGHFGEFANIFGVSSQRTSRRFNAAYGRDPSGAASSAWLETRYGWTPTILDIHDAAATLADLINTESANLAKLSARESQNESSNYSYMMENDPAMPVKVTSLTERKLRIQVWYKRDVTTSAPKALGLGDVGLFYEVFPLSFVADWFIPIGDYLSSFNATQGLTFEKGSYSVQKRRYTSVVGDNNEYYSTSGMYSYEYSCSERRRMVGFPNPRFPSFSLAPSLNRFFDSLALTRQIFGKK